MQIFVLQILINQSRCDFQFSIPWLEFNVSLSLSTFPQRDAELFQDVYRLLLVIYVQDFMQNKILIKKIKK